MPTFASPKVIWSEIDISSYSPNKLSTPGAIVVRAKKGPIEPVFVSSVDRYKLLFTTAGTVESDVLEHYVALSFLSKEGAGLWVVRAIGSGALYGGAVVVEDGASGDSYSLTSGLADPNDYAWQTEDCLLFIGADPGAWNNDLIVTISDVNADDKTFRVLVHYRGELVESFLCSLVSNVKDGWGNSLYVENVINNRSDYIRVYKNPSSTAELPKETTSLYLAEGNDGSSVSSGDLITAWNLYRNTDQYAIRLLIQGGIADEQIQTNMVNIAESRQDCVALLDVPYDITSVEDVISYRDTTLAVDSSYAALFAPWIKTYDYDNDEQMIIPPSGIVAGLMATTDRYYRPWVAAAGVNRGAISALGLTAYYTEADHDQLAPKRINIFRRFPGQYVLWGYETLQINDSAFTYLEIRRGLIEMRASLVKLAKSYLFEPLIEDTRRNFVGAITDYLTEVKRTGGLYDFLVKCDPLGDPDGNNPPINIDNGILTADLFLKPVRGIRGIHLRAVITRTGVDFEEVGGIAF